MQGIQGIRSHSRRAAAPSSSPANTRADSSEQRFFDKLRRPALFPEPGADIFILMSQEALGTAGTGRPAGRKPSKITRHPSRSTCSMVCRLCTVQQNTGSR